MIKNLITWLWLLVIIAVQSDSLAGEWGEVWKTMWWQNISVPSLYPGTLHQVSCLQTKSSTNIVCSQLSKPRNWLKKPHQPRSVKNKVLYNQQLVRMKFFWWDIVILINHTDWWFPDVRVSSQYQQLLMMMMIIMWVGEIVTNIIHHHQIRLKQ